jgi:acyl carrier protein
VTDLNFDSLDQVDFVMKIEEAFNVEISDQRAEDIRTVGQAVDVLTGLLAEARAAG